MRIAGTGGSSNPAVCHGVDAGQQGDLLVGAELGEQVLVEAGRHGRMVAMTNV